MKRRTHASGIFLWMCIAGSTNCTIVFSEAGSDNQPGDGHEGEILADDPILYWRFDEQEGASFAEDSSGNGRHGLYHGTPTLGVTGAGSSEDNIAAIQFDGRDGTFVSLDDSSDLAFLGVEPFTFEAWVQIDSSDGSINGIASKGPGAPDPAFEVFVQGGTIKFQRNNSENWEGPWAENVEYATFKHVAATFDGVGMKLFVDARVSSVSTSLEVVDSGVSFAAGFNFNGKIDELAIYNYALPSDRILVHSEALK